MLYDVSEVKEVVLSGVFAFVAGFCLWPPRRNYWASLLGPSSGYIAIAVVILLSILLGTGFEQITDVRLLSFVVGGIIAYIVGMWWIEIEMEPISPVHLILYGVVLIGLVGGVAVSGYG